MTYRIAPFPMTEWPSKSFTYCTPFEMGFFAQFCSNWQDWRSLSHCDSCGPSVITELLVRVVCASVVALFLSLAKKLNTFETTHFGAKNPSIFNEKRTGRVDTRVP